MNGGDVDVVPSAAQGSVGGLCDSHDSSVSRRAFLKSLIQVRMRDMNDDAGKESGIGETDRRHSYHT